MPVLAPAVRLFAPEYWGEVGRFRRFYQTTYAFDERDARALGGVEAHLVKYQRLKALAEKLRPNLAIDETQLDVRGFTPADNAGELATVIGAAVLSNSILRSLVRRRCCARSLVPRQTVSKNRRAPCSRIAASSLVSGGAEARVRRCRGRLVSQHLASTRRADPPRDRRCPARQPVRACLLPSFGSQAWRKPLEIPDIFGWLEATADHINAFLGTVFHHLNGTLNDVPVMEPCGVVEGQRILMRQLRPARPITFDSGVCMSWRWLELPGNPTCPFKDHCGAYRNKGAMPAGA